MNEWMEHPDLANLDPLKQELIRTAALKAGGKNGKALVPVMMSLIVGANKRGIRFTPDEISLILSAIKEGKSKPEGFRTLRGIAQYQLRVLSEAERIKELPEGGETEL